MLPNVQKLLLQTFPLSLKVTELATLSRRRNLKKLTKQSYTFEKTVNLSCKNSTVCPKNVRVPPPRKGIKCEPSP